MYLSDGEGRNYTDLLFLDSLPRGFQQPVLGQIEARNSELHPNPLHGWAGTQLIKLSSVASQVYVRWKLELADA